ncbi:hypothetical protein GCM10010960_04420 [Arenimonas maotaiensis]|uniref:Type 4 fimbrial biogenesis protein PilX N-terminal domain-containing protein n=1 Tax=Arenimonas maotaiensis TaxID=1446479 RepID=A0A917CDU5_9GAMM|nr:PilX N-terminal domain-containing pilus assembly protein [Arenimonas maotaiensis]GGF85527.1 hypothetical protein GCM10010960_04420 [Arenimonas maotaiensis]
MNTSISAISYRRQRGVSTLAITMLLLIILSLVVLFSTSVGFFEQRTATNENRARIAEQAAEAGINLAGEALKANRDKVISNITGGWLDSTANNAGWKTCAGVTDTATIDGRPHPCRSESDGTRRAQLWFYTTDGTGASTATTRFIPSTSIGNVGGAAAFPSVVDVQAVLCRIDSSLATPACASSPAKGNRIAVTFIATATLTNENTTAVIKETWASYTDASQTSSVPIIGSGFVKGLGNAQIVTNPNAGGYGVPASIWSPNDVGVDGSGGGLCPASGGVGSVATCQLGEYLKNTPVSELKTTCVTTNNACGCPAITGSGSNFLSGHSAGTKKEGLDILDRDGGNGTLPDVGFFPGLDCNGNNLSDLNVTTDDSLFEWIFNASSVVDEGANAVNTNCGPASNQNCASYTLIDELDAEVITCAQLNALGASASGLYYIQGTCSLPSQVGSPNAPAIVVLEGEATVNNTDFFGLLFVRSNNNTAQFKGVGNSKIIGSLVVEGDIDIAGTIDIIYDNTAVSTDPNQLPKNAKFARVPGSWLDATEGF